MSRLFSELSKEVDEQQKALRNRKEEPAKQSLVTDAETSESDVGIQHLHHTLDTDKLRVIIGELSEIKVSTHGTPVRLSEAERRDIEDFIYTTLRKKGINGRAVSSAKLMRFAVRYLMKVHEREFVEALSAALTKEER